MTSTLSTMQRGSQATWHPWQARMQLYMQAVRACPVCRQVTHYVTPSLVWPADEDEKEAIRDAYKNKLGSIDCR